MNAILFVIDRPAETDARQAREWQSALNNLRSIEPTSKEGEILSSNCWLLQMPDGARPLGYAIVECDKAHIRYRLLILQDKDLEWVAPSQRT
jgi:hypothetical protein